ncbi:unnamed protein product [Cylicocyclus nassatus]|uniref:Uncharacterized protein n=1 Tax=Cylicocyclus nassatus TaxID=53992 RepID=A0AA36GTR6_CYLNA|nr:unnamed protein product [Cylicocyclus nassatus]
MGISFGKKMAVKWVSSKRSQLIGACAFFFITYAVIASLPQSPTNNILERSCSCSHKNVTYDFCYHLPKNRMIKGRPFDCNFSTYLEELEILPLKKIVDLVTEEMPVPAFVTAMSQNHYAEGLTLIANLRSLWPRQKVIVYDLGLDPESKKELQKKCLVEVRSFPFERFPRYVHDLTQFRWKPLLIGMALKEFGAIWYMDTSVRWKRDCRKSVYNEITCRKKFKPAHFPRPFLPTGPANSGCKKPAYMLHSPSHHSIFAATHPGMYSYIPTDIEAIKKNESMNYDANFQFIVKTTDALEILKWYVLCALEKECMAPYAARVWCDFKNDQYYRYAGCHRYDQSAINLLLANSYGYNIANYVSNLGDGAVIDRSAKSGLTEEDFSCTERVVHS